MDCMALAHINPRMLAWARENCHLALDQLGFPPERVAEWESGQQFPTVAQAEVLATKLQVPFLALFLSNPPGGESLPIPDKRTLKDGSRGKLSANFRDALKGAIVKQDWYREQFSGQKAPISLTRFSIEDAIEDVAAFVRRALRINEELRRQCRNWEEFLLRIIENAENAGVIVLRSGFVRSATKRRLSVDEFRGFALADPVAPLIFVNANDTTTAQIFTVAHELVHIVLEQSAISNPSPTRGASAERSALEKFCNKVAAEVLVPQDMFLRAWRRDFSNEENLARIVRFFRVSNLVALRRAHDLNKIPSDYFFRSAKLDYERFRRQKEEEEERRKERTGGPNIFTTLATRNSARFTTALITELRGGRVAYTDAAKLLALKIPALESYIRAKVA
jgi:Zn-dependent peptidase ImmA (M78 family)